MSHALHKLTARKVESVKAPGRYSDGGGLSLRLAPDGSKRWVFCWERNKQRREMGLGPLTDVSLADARDLAADARALLAKGIDPLEKKRAQRPAPVQRPAPAPRKKGTPTFGVFANDYIDSREDGWKNAKHRQQWRNTIETYAAPIRDIPVDVVDVDDVVAILKPIWTRVPETAGRLRGRIENILDAARASKLIKGPWENPARWRGNLVHLMPRGRKKSQVRHHPAMPYDDLPAFFAQLGRQTRAAARALEFTILTAARTSETLRMTWEEVDLDRAIWTVPAIRMKMEVEHRVPLSDQAMAILRAMKKDRCAQPQDFVFPGHKKGCPFSQMAMAMVMRHMKQGHFTVHGMRSTFRDYMGDMTSHPETVVEQALAHQVGDETVRAYRRGDAFLKRRGMMQDWADYVCQVRPRQRVRVARDTSRMPRRMQRRSEAVHADVMR